MKCIRVTFIVCLAVSLLAPIVDALTPTVVPEGILSDFECSGDMNMNHIITTLDAQLTFMAEP